tara:strand:+ start:701 stop:814 length:114 start_codon:yes stop_codon:yes gene_type:complete
MVVSLKNAAAHMHAAFLSAENGAQVTDLFISTLVLFL